MAVRIAGPGQSLPRPRALYPTTLVDSPFAAPTSRVSLQAGQVLMVPGGSWFASGGAASALEYLDPVSNQWITLNPPGTAWYDSFFSDGQNVRIHNISGVATGATVTAGGSGYVQSTVLVTPSAGNSIWRAVVGGALGAYTVVNGGSGFTMVPLVFIAAPPTPGVMAEAHATVAGGVVTAITADVAGAGYLTPPTIIILPSPNDPNINNIRPASATVVLGATDAITAVLLVNAGVQLAAAPTLTIAGGTGGTATVIPASGSWVAPAADNTVVLQPAPG